jgi:RNA polymerase sigma-70 factor (ECF subfamily)
VAKDHEQELISRIVKGAAEEFRHVVQAYQNFIFALIMRQVGNRATADDLTQETFVKAFFNLKSFRSQSKLSTWLVRIALNTTSSYFTSRRYKQGLLTEEYKPQHCEQRSFHAEQDAQLEDKLRLEKRLAIFHQALAQLKPLFRDVFTLCALEQKSYDEAAEILDIPLGTVRSRLNRARLELSKIAQKMEEA